MIWIAQAQSAQEISGASEDDGSYRIRIIPEVTTFSDNAVVSYPGAAEDYLPHSLWAEIACKDAIRVLSAVAEMALRIGLLVRGGLSFGQLYHHDRVVFGEAVVDAYALEKDIAVFPRTVVSDRVIAKLNHTRPKDLRDVLLRDTDGRWHLNYIKGMMRHAAPPGPTALDEAAAWKRAHLHTINRAIEELRGSSASEAARRAAKWEWFKTQFEATTARLGS